MSTNINITVGDNALLDRAKQQQAANRQVQLNRENSTRLEAQATDERTKAQAAAGKDANGNPLYGVLTTTPSIDRRPAANRQGDVAILLVPSSPFTELGIAAKTRKLPTPQIFELGPDFPAAVVADGGPAGAPAILSPASLGPGGLEKYGGYLGVFSEPAFFKVRSRKWTFEGYLRRGSASTSSSIDYDGYVMTLYWYEGFYNGVLGLYAVVEFIVPGANSLDSYDQIDPGAPPSNRFEYRSIAVATLGTWVHMAIVQEPTQYKIFLDGILLQTIEPEPNTENPYYGYIDYVDYTARGRYDIFDNLENNDPPEAAVKPGIHGYRFTSGKTLYTSNFTPPPSITNFA